MIFALILRLLTPAPAHRVLPPPPPPRSVYDKGKVRAKDPKCPKGSGGDGDPPPLSKSDAIELFLPPFVYGPDFWIPIFRENDVVLPGMGPREQI